MTDKKFTDEEIIKALECRTKAVSGVRKCEKCPLYTKFQCLYAIKVYALDLINRQKSEIDNLNKQMEWLTGYNGNLINANTALSEENMLAKTEAYKEFAEKLKSYLLLNKKGEMSVISFENVDNLLKEMVGEEE